MSLTKEVHRLMKTVRKRTDGQVTVVGFEPCETDECQILTVAVEPNDGLYKGGRFTFLIQIPDGYPHSDQPTVWCQSDVYHPNIDTTESRYDASATNVCLNMFDRDTWNNSFGLETIVHGLVFLMHHPNFDDPLSPFFEPGNIEHEESNIKLFMAGEEIDGRVFELETTAEPRQDNDTNANNELELTGTDKQDNDKKEMDKSNKETEKPTKEGDNLVDKCTTEVAENENEDDGEKCGDGFRVIAIAGGELVLIADGRFQTPEEIAEPNTEDARTDKNNDESDDYHTVTTVAQENTTLGSDTGKLNGATELIETGDYNTETAVTRNALDNQPNTDTESSILTVATDDNDTNIKRCFSTTEPDHNDAEKDQEHFGVAKLNDHVNKLIDSEILQNKVSTVMIILANLHFIGGKVLRCLNERYT